MTAKVLIVLAGLAAAAPAAAADAPPPPQTAVPRPEYRCPTTGYLNCMPPIAADRRQACAKDYVAWVAKNCPKTQVVY
jgi:hypothetical protein